MTEQKRLGKNFLSSNDLTREEFLIILDLAEKFKSKQLTLEYKNKVL